MIRYLQQGGYAQGRSEYDVQVFHTVEGILKDVQERGDAAVRDHRRKFHDLDPAAFTLSQGDVKAPIGKLSAREVEDIRFAQKQICNHTGIQCDSIRDVDVEVEILPAVCWLTPSSEPTWSRASRLAI